MQQREVRQEKVVEAPSVSNTDRMLTYHAAAAALPREQIVKEIEGSRRKYESVGGSSARIQLILARLALHGDARERDKALELLQLQLSSKDDIDAGMTALLQLLRTILVENRQLESSLEAQREKLKEESKRAEALKQKLDALVEAERKLQERNRPKQ
ncbi:MAG: hypothetical protein FJY37_03505 [Betaproteobacteria bacterium]|nr:hypothetical protein [Betaproteobacteria bacterium]